MKTITGKPSVIKAVNTNYVKQIILQNKQITKPQIAQLTNLSLTTVNKIVDNLLVKQEIKETDYSAFTGGRRALNYALNENFQSILGILIQENTYYISLYNLLGDRQISEVFYHQNTLSWTNELKTIIDKFLEYKEYNIVCLGIGVPGTVSNNIISNIPSIIEWENIDLYSILKKYYDINIIIENDINCIAIGMHNNIISSSDMTFFLHIQEGIKSSIIIDKKLYKGRHNFSGELSYMKLDINQTENLETIIQKYNISKQYDKLVTYISLILLNTICILEPSLIIIESKYVYERMVDDLKTELSKHINVKYIPEILLVYNKETYYYQGIFQICFDSMQDKTTIINKK